MKLLIFYLTDNRRHFTFPHFINMLNASSKKDLWKLLIATHTCDNNFYIEELNKYDINYDIVNVPTDNNYLRKVKYSANYANQNNFPYVMKCDNDIFLKAQTLDYMIDNLSFLENGKHLTIGPTLTSGIPGIEYFKDSFLDNEAKLNIEKLYIIKGETVIKWLTDFKVFDKKLIDYKIRMRSFLYFYAFNIDTSIFE